MSSNRRVFQTEGGVIVKDWPPYNVGHKIKSRFKKQQFV